MLIAQAIARLRRVRTTCLMKICQHCFTQTDDGAVFCDLCGHEFSAAQPTEWRTTPPLARIPMPEPIAPPAPAAPVAPGVQAASLRDARGGAASPTPQAVIDVARLVISLRSANGQRFNLTGKNDYTIGRASPDRADPDVNVAAAYDTDAGVSRAHVMVHVRADGVFVEDLESTNETVHNGYRLLPLQWYPLHDGDQLKLGAVTLYVSFSQK